MLKGKIAIVTGGASGIGACVTRKLASYGSTVVIASRDAEKAKEIVEKVRASDGCSMWLKTDVTNAKECEKTVSATVESFGRVDILVHCSGISSACKVIDMTDEIWERTMNVNLKGALNINLACIKVMSKIGYGRIVNVASISGKTPEWMNCAYCVSKAGVMMLTQCIALEQATNGITANAVCPGPTNTKMMQQVLKERGAIEGITAKEYEKKFLADIPLNRMAEPEEVAELVCFLADDSAAYITGQCITISGGKIWV